MVLVMASPKKSKVTRRTPGPSERQRKEHARRETDMRTAVRTYLEQAGVETGVLAGGVELGQRRYLFSGHDHYAYRTGDVDGVIDRVVAKLCPDRLLNVAVEQLAGRGFELRATQGRYGVRLHQTGGHAIAVISATRATFDVHKSVHGNFLLEGEHWATVRARLPQPIVKRSPSPARSELPRGRRVLTELPAAASEVQRAAALAASARIRHERTLDFGQAVVLRLPDRSLRFLPISEHAQAVEVRFIYDHRGETLSGALRLRSIHDPLALAVTWDVPSEQLVAAAWVTALLGYAELTCVPQAAERADDVEPAAGDRRQRSRAPAARTVAVHARDPTRRRAGPKLSASLEPTGETQTMLASFVVGHRRLLPAGRQPSADAKRRAQAIGVGLAERETWVRPHARGIPTNSELVFAWRMKLPAALM